MWARRRDTVVERHRVSSGIVRSQVPVPGGRRKHVAWGEHLPTSNCRDQGASMWPRRNQTPSLRGAG